MSVRVTKVILCMAAAPLLTWLLLILRFGSTSAAAAYLVGHPYALSPQVIHMDDLSAGSNRTFEVSFKNLSNVPLLVAGARTSCGCMVASGLPVNVPEFGDSDIEFNIQVPRDFPLQQFEHEIHLYVNGFGWTHPVLVRGKVDSHFESVDRHSNVPK